MKRLLIVANWKSNKTEKDASDWFKKIFPNLDVPAGTKVVVCPSFPLLSVCKKIAGDFALGAQDVSQFAGGAHTGEVNAKQLQDFVSWVIIGHSERRVMGETDETLQQKVAMAKENNLKIIYCVSSQDQNIPEDINAIAYEPIFAIGSGNPDTPENAEKVAKALRKKTTAEFILYGGSVNAKNVSNFLSSCSINGVLVGGTSLDPLEFKKIVETNVS